MSASRITFLASGVCSAAGAYTWTVTGKTLTFRKIRDGCRKRDVQLVRRWTRVMP